MMNTEENNFFPIIIQIVCFLMVLALSSYFIRNMVGLNFHLYSVSFGPFFEEAFKGAVVVLFFLIFFNTRPNMRKSLDTKRNWFIAGGLFGLFIGLYEAFVEYSPGLIRVIPTLNHVFWTATVGTGIWIYINSGRKWKVPKLLFPYSMASISHVFWNYHSFLTEVEGQEVIFGIMTWITILSGLFFIWRINDSGS